MEQNYPCTQKINLLAGKTMKFMGLKLSGSKCLHYKLYLGSKCAWGLKYIWGPNVFEPCKKVLSKCQVSVRQVSGMLEENAVYVPSKH